MDSILTSISEDNLLVLTLLLPSVIFLFRLSVFWLLLFFPQTIHAPFLIPDTTSASHVIILPPQPLKDLKIWIKLCLNFWTLDSSLPVQSAIHTTSYHASHCLSYKLGNSQTQNHHSELNHFLFLKIYAFLLPHASGMLLPITPF